jgi:PAS domain S-box-containing protein
VEIKTGRLNEELRVQAARAEALADERDQFFNSSRDLLAVAGTDGMFKRVSPSWERTLGWTEAEMLRRPYLELIHPDDREATIREARGLAEGRETVAFENRYVAKDGSYRWLDWTARLDRPGGCSIHCVARDVTARKQAEDRFRAVVEAAPNAIVMVDEAGRIVLVNELTERIFGYARSELLDRPVELLLPERFRAKHPDLRAQFFAGPSRRAMGSGRDLFGLRKDGTEVAIEIGLSPIPSNEGVVVLAAVVDITLRKRAEDELRGLNADLRRRSEEVEAANLELDAFSYSVSHDLRAPLRSIHGFSQAILEDNAGKFDPETEANFRRVQAAAKRMGQLVDDLLMLSRITRSEKVRQAVDLSALAGEVASDLRQGEPLRQVHLVVEEGLTAGGDPRLLRVVLENLIGNAWKFTSKLPRASIEFGAVDADGERRFFVRDDGAGFDMAYAEKLFGAFQRLHAQSEFPGTGIGLATVARVVHRHGGRIWAEAAQGRGATFWFTLPANGGTGGSHGEQAAAPAGG